MPRIVLHLGAHKTASTHLQKSLAAARADLAAGGCTYLGPDLLRRELRIPSLERPLKGILRKSAALRAALADITTPRLLLSDENILGETRPPSLAQGDQLYPGAEARLGKLLAALEMEGVTLALALRDPLALMVSGWGHQHVAGREVSFAEYCAAVQPAALRWSGLVERLMGCAGVRDLLLWRYEEYGGLAAEIGQRLTGLACVPVLAGGQGGALLAGPSARALSEAAAIRRAQPGLDYKHALRRAMRRYPRGPDTPAPQLFAPEEMAASARAYRDDWERLCAMEDVTCLTLSDPV